jgi:hypothetical protein
MTYDPYRQPPYVRPDDQPPVVSGPPAWGAPPPGQYPPPGQAQYPPPGQAQYPPPGQAQYPPPGQAQYSQYPPPGQGHYSQYPPTGNPYAPPPGVHPYGMPPLPPPQQKTKPWVWIVAGVAVLFSLCLIVGAVNNFADSPSTPAAADQESAAAKPDKTGKAATKAAEKPKTAGIGDPVRDGKFEFVVTGMDCSKTTLGDSFLNTKAQGTFCVVTVSVKNIGDEAQLFAGSNQKAYDGRGAEYENDGSAEFYANDDNQTFLNDVNPGNKVTGKIVFDVPKGTKLTTIELHDSFFSGGVKVALS